MAVDVNCSISRQINSSFEDLSQEKFSNQLKDIKLGLAKQARDNTWLIKNPYPEPIVLQDSTYQLLKDFNHAISIAARAIVENYFLDSRISEILKLSSRSAKILEALKDQPYENIGTLRPDIIIDDTGLPRLCEINARFPFNGFLISNYLSQALFENTEHNYKPIAEYKLIPEALIPSNDVLIIKGIERGWDISFFREEMRERGLGVSYLPPITEVLEGWLNSTKHINKSIVLELHQNEIETLPPDLLCRLNYQVHLNDLRTVLILHDKRLLALFHDPLLADYIPSQQYSLLKSLTIPTFVVGNSPDIVSEALSNKNAWLLKPNLLGKSKGIIVGSKVSEKIWEQVINNPAHANYVLQPLIKSDLPNLPYLSPQQKLVFKPTRLVGTILQCNGSFLGAGVFRATDGAILGDGEVFVIPAVRSLQGEGNIFTW